MILERNNNDYEKIRAGFQPTKTTQLQLEPRSELE